LTTETVEKMPAVDESTRLREVAERIAARLGERDDIDAVLLYGSVARGDAGPDSDIDLLVIGEDAGQTIAGLRHWVTDIDREHRAGIAFHTRESFAAIVEEGSRFLVHLRREGKVLLDRTGQLQAFLASPWRPVSVDNEIAEELDRLSNYDRPELFGGRFLFPLAHVFTIGKAIVMARLADEGVLEFNRRRAFAEYARRHPAVAPDVELIASLEPFLARTRRLPASLPFAPAGRAAAEELEAGVAAVRRVAATRA
jgi:predicted nucleotidyltransferase